MAKHNERRRKNRAIKNNVIEWARREGCGESELQRLQAAPPKVAKDWAEARGANPEHFVDGIPDRPLQGDHSPVAGGGGVRDRAPGSAAGGGAVGGGRAGRRAAGGAPGPGIPQHAAWTSSDWCTGQMQSRVEAIQAQQGHHRDERSLLSGVPETVRATSGGTNETFQIEFSNGIVGYFKPFDGVNKQIAKRFGHAGVEQPLHEAAAWRLASEMGEPYSQMVPPVVVREIKGQMGSVGLGAPGRSHHWDPWDVPEWRDAALFDSLIGQQDRHPGNYLVAGDRVALIDHGYAFATDGNRLNWSHLQAKRCETDPSLTPRERSLLERIVSSRDVLGLESMIGTRRAGAVRDRATRMLATNKVLDAGAY